MQIKSVDAPRASKRYAKPTVLRIATQQVLLDLIEWAEHDNVLAAHLKASIHQSDPEYKE